MANMILITGGARSGKSHFAQALAERHPGQLLFVATATESDGEMAARIVQHKRDRGPRWDTLEEPLDWVQGLLHRTENTAAILIECVTVWISHLLVVEKLDEPAILKRVEEAVVAMQSLACPVYWVSNEVGQGIVPSSKLGRRFRDLAGRVNQHLGRTANEAWVLFAGLPMRLK